MSLNQFNQTIGDPVSDFQPADLPDTETLNGTYCRLEKLKQSHFEDLYAVFGPDTPPENWTYLPFSQMESVDQFQVFFDTMLHSKDPFHYAIVDQKSNKVLGTVALMRINREVNSIEVGYVVYSEALKRTRTATEAQLLLGMYAFEVLGYRRYEWKCDALNLPSRLAAQRLGFTFEGVFRNASVYKGRNRDTAWFSIIESEWEVCKRRMLLWLSPSNFDDHHQQIQSLHDFK